MYLKRIELHGFKSFADKTTIEFKDGITGVVGPNGSGKSNIADSIRWVLGEQSAKTLRGGKMQDIIFSGTTTRKPVGYAEMTLVLDNKDKTLALDYSEVNITRRIFRSGDSEYYINKTACRLKDIKELFMDTGVGIDGYSIVGQGRIDEILSTKSEDRRNLFEEAAGIVKFKNRKKEAERKLGKTEDNLSRINDIIHELEGQIAPLEAQSKKAKKYLELSQKLKKDEVNLYIHEIEHIQEKKNVIKKQMDSLQRQKSFYIMENEKAEKMLNEYKEKIDAINKSIEDDSDLKYDMQSKIEKKDADILLLNERNIFLKSENERLAKESDLAKDNMQSGKEEKENLHNKVELLKEEIASLEQKVQDSNNELLEIKSVIEGNQKHIEDKKSELIQNLNLEAEKKSKVNMMESFNKNIDKRIEQLNLEIEENRNLLLEKDESIKENLINKENADDEIKKIESIIKENIGNRKEYIQTYNDKLRHRDTVKSELHGEFTKAKLLKDMQEEYDGFYKSVKNILVACKGNNSFGKGIKGVVAELIKVDKRYERAIEIALGSGIQNVVTENDVFAKEAVEYLKKNRLGRVTFLPLNLIRGGRINEGYDNFTGFEGIACDLVQFEDKYKTIFEYLLGKTIIVDNLNNGIKLQKKLKRYAKIVTLDGDVLSPAGSITGGSYNKKNTSILSRKRTIDELEKSIEQGKIKLNDIENECVKYQEMIKNAEDTVNNKRNDLDIAKVKKINLENDIKKEQENIVSLQNAIDKLKGQEESLLKENTGSKDDLEIIKKEIIDINNKNEEIKAYIEECDNANDLKKEEYENKNKDAVDDRLKLRSTVENHKYLLENIDKLDISRQQDSSKLSEIARMLEENANKIEDNIQRQGAFKEEKEGMLKVLSEFSDKLEGYKEEKQRLIKVYDDKQVEFKAIMNKMNDFNEELRKVELKNEKYSMQLDNYNNKLWEQYEMSYQMALEFKEDIDNLDIIKNEVMKLRRSIKSLGNINLDSMQQYKSITERYEFMTSQRDDLTTAKESLNQVITDMEIKMKDKFKKNFKLIKEHFSEVFVQLFGGGKADIYLENEEDVLTSGIEIIAQPPGKKLQSILLLSGGEKALTAIALLFAILKLKPTPFCILDEIEAALDDANVYRFADYLRHYSNKTQFIVITHRKGTMECVDTLYGVTMQEKGVSKVLSVQLSDVIDEVAIAK